MQNRLFAEIAETKLFNGVNIEEIERVLAWCKVLELATGHILLKPEQGNDHLYVLLEGQLDIHLSNLQEPCYLRLEAGDCVGEMSVIEACEASAFVVASAPCRVLSIPRDIIWSLISASHALARNMLITLSSRVRFGNEAVRNSIHRQSEFESLAFVDGLTGLHNRRWLDQAFRRQVERALRDGKPLALLMIDIDNFKRYNDTYGHLSGDRSLRAVALTLNDNLRPGDLLARFGGEEFAVLLPDTAAAQSGMIAERLRRAVAQPHQGEQQALPSISISLGDTQLAAEDTLEKILERADAALYLAKTAGRNCVRSA